MNNLKTVHDRGSAEKEIKNPQSNNIPLDLISAERVPSEECCQIKFPTEEKRYCFCSQTEIFKHKHGPACGHIPILHNGHFDYIVGTTLHSPHEGHCDDHGKIIFYADIWLCIQLVNLFKNKVYKIT